MKTISRAFLVLALSLLAALPAFAEAPATPTTLTTQLDQIMSTTLAADEPGATVIVIRDGETLLRKGYGMADLENGVANAPEMVFRLGSITKQFTAVAIMLLAQEGKLAVTDPVTRFLPDYPTHGQTITIEHLLQHTGGLPNYTDLSEFWPIARLDKSTAEMLDVFKNEDLVFPPGTRWAYSNSGYFLLGALIEKVSGKSYADFVRERIFEPLGMSASSYEDPEQLVAHRARGYAKAENGWRNAPFMSMKLPGAAGALISNVDDLARWDAALYTEKLLPRAVLEKMWTSGVLTNGESIGYGYGWAVGEYAGSPVIHHDGGIFGFSTSAIRMPKEKVYVAVLSNNTGGGVDPSGLARRAASLVAGKPVDRVAVEIAPEILERYVGVYAINDNEDRVVTLENGKLHTQRTKSAKLPVTFSSETEFFYENLTRGRFVVENGKVVGMALTPWGRPEETARRTDKPLPKEPEVAKVDPAVYDAYVGRYEIAPQFSLTVRREGDKLMVQGTGQPPIEVLPQSETVFFSALVGAKITFVKGDSGAVESLLLEQGGQTLPGKKVE